jgi:carboxymethylenebutenolidase
MHRRNFLLGAIGAAVVSSGRRARAQATEPTFSEVFFRSGTLNIQAYLYRPKLDRPAPLIIYNHGFRPDARSLRPFPFLGRLFNDAGFGALVVERRGWGKSDGETYQSSVGNSVGEALVDRLRAESDDVLAAQEFAKRLDGVDADRIGVVGWSLGGIITMLTISRTAAFKAAVSQAGGALLWNRSPAIQAALVAAGRDAKAPAMLMVAENDRTTEAARAVAAAMAAAGRPHELKIYPPYDPPKPDPTTAPGHLLFGMAGVGIWGVDAVNFLRRHLAS